MYSIEDLRSFVIIAEMGGITAAARRMGLAPATVSHRLAKLEAALQLTLFHRNSRSLQVTPEGQVFLDRIQPILADLSQAELEAGSGMAALSGTLRITLSPWILSRFILPALPAFRREHPHLTFEFLAVDRYVSLVAEGQDCGIRVGQLEDSALVARKLIDNERIICCSPEFLAAHGPFAQTQALIDAPWVCLPWQRRVALRDAKGRRRDALMRSPILVSSSDMLTEGALQGLGLVIKSRLAVMTELRQQRLVEVAAGALWEPSAPIWFVFSPEARSSRKIRLFSDLARNAFHIAGDVGDRAGACTSPPSHGPAGQ